MKEIWLLLLKGQDMTLSRSRWWVQFPQGLFDTYHIPLSRALFSALLDIREVKGDCSIMMELTFVSVGSIPA